MHLHMNYFTNNTKEMLQTKEVNWENNAVIMIAVWSYEQEQ